MKKNYVQCSIEIVKLNTGDICQGSNEIETETVDDLDIAIFNSIGGL